MDMCSVICAFASRNTRFSHLYHLKHGATYTALWQHHTEKLRTISIKYKALNPYLTYSARTQSNGISLAQAQPKWSCKTAHFNSEIIPRINTFATLIYENLIQNTLSWILWVCWANLHLLCKLGRFPPLLASPLPHSPLLLSLLTPVIICFGGLKGASGEEKLTTPAQQMKACSANT